MRSNVKTIGKWIVAVGIMAVMAALALDTTNNGYHNIGLMSEKQNLVILSIAITIIGVIVIGFGSEKAPAPIGKSAVSTNVGPSGSRACPFCAEMVRPQAILCRFCNSKIEPISQDLLEACPDVLPRVQNKENSWGAFFDSLVALSSMDDSGPKKTPIKTSQETIDMDEYWETFKKRFRFKSREK